MSPEDRERTKIFISYSHRDAEWLERLRVHLKPLEREYNVEIWSDTDIAPGSKWREEIRRTIERTKVAILLVSADFLASDFIAKDELPPLLAAAESDGAIILPLIISPSMFPVMDFISQFQSVNAPSRPLINMTKGEQEETFVKVAGYIKTSLTGQSEQLEAKDGKIAAIDYLVVELRKKGWKKIHSGSHADVEFDLIGSRSFVITKWHVLVKMLPFFDTAQMLEWQRIFNAISAKSKSWVWGECFILCLVAKKVSSVASGSLENDDFGLFGAYRLRGGGGLILIVDEEAGKVYGDVPALPYDAHIYTKDLKDSLVSMLEL